MYRNNPEKIDESINGAARFIVKNGLSDLFKIYLKLTLPMATILGNIIGISYYPFAALFGGSAQNYTALLTFNTRENLKQILKKVEELEEENLS